MAAPNIVNITSMIGKTDTTSLTTTSATNLLNNAASSGKVLRVILIRAVNTDGSNAANISVGLYSAASLGGAQTELIQAKAVAVNTNLDVVTKDTPLYLEEDTSLGATASAANDIKMIVTYEEIS
tara:strand:+ start:78 stop:452 length:375 start_codon:yes stop_codon:yes gene_type:complete